MPRKIAGSILESTTHEKSDEQNVSTEENARTWTRTCRNTGKVLREVKEKDQEPNEGADEGKKSLGMEWSSPW